MSITMTINGNSSYALEGSLSINDNINDRSTASFLIQTTGTYGIGQEVIFYDIEESEILDSSIGSYGGEYITDTSIYIPTNDKFIAIQSITNAVIDTCIGSPDINGLEMTYGDIIYGNWSSIKLASGSIIAYEGVSATRIFAGTIENLSYTVLRGTNIKEYSIECIDFNQITDRLRIAQTYQNQTVTEIVTDIISKYLSAEGISLGTVTTTSPVILQANFNYIKVSDALKYLQDATQVNWNIDYNKNLNLFFRSDNTTTGLIDSDILDMEISESRQQYINTQWLKAGDGTTESQVLEKPTPEPDGTSKTFLVRFPLSKKPSLFINSVQVSESDIGINGLDRGKKWYWNKNKKEIVQDDTETNLTSSDTLEITYNGLVPVLAKVENPTQISARQSVEGGSGIYEGFEKRIALSDKVAAIKYAEGLLNKFDEVPEVIRLRTKIFKNAGSIININSTSFNKNEDYLIENVTITEQAGVLYYDMHLLSGESFGSWVEFFRKMITTADDFIIQENEVVIQAHSDTETRNRDGSTNIKTFNALFPSDTLYPSNTLYPNTAVVTEVDIIE